MHRRSLDIAPGFPGNALSDEQQLARFHDCMAYAALPLPRAKIDRFLGAVERLGSIADARSLVDDLIV